MYAVSPTRHSERFSVKSQVSFCRPKNNQLFSALLHDLNYGGACIFSSYIVSAGEKITLWLLNPKTSKLIRVKGEIAWVGVDDIYGDSPYWLRAGIAFEGLNHEQTRAIKKLLPIEAKLRPTKKETKHLLAVLP